MDSEEQNQSSEARDYRQFAINLNCMYENTAEFREGAKRYLIYIQKLYSIKEYYLMKGYAIDSKNDSLEYHFYLADKLAETFPYLYINTNEDFVCDLCADIDIPIEDERYYIFFLNIKLEQLRHIEIDDLLNYQLKTTFNNQHEKFIRFLILFLRDVNKTLIQSKRDSVKEWIELKQQQLINTKTAPLKTNNEKLNWSGSPQEVINGFQYLMTNNCSKGIPYCQIENLKAFVYSNFSFKNTNIKLNSTDSFNFKWNSEKHDFTMLLKLLKVKKINATNREIKNFILRLIPHSSEDAIIVYLKGERVKQKFSIDISVFSL